MVEVLLINLITMNIIKSIIGYDAWGNPIDFIDEDGTLWIYQGKNDGNDSWAGCPNYDD